MIIGDFHIHSTFSDGQLTIPELIDYYGKRKVKVIAITDHLCDQRSLIGKATNWLNKTLNRHSFSEYQRVIEEEQKRAWEQYQLLVIPGFEITHNSFLYDQSAHFLALGLTEFVNPDLTIEEITTKVRQLGGITIAAHPVSTGFKEHQTYYLWSKKEKFACYFDAWEVASGPIIFNEVLESGLPLLASSDFHKPSQFGSWKTVLPSECLDQASVLKAVKEQRISFVYYSEQEEVEVLIRPKSITRRFSHNKTQKKSLYF